MAKIPKKVEERIKTGIKAYSKILEQVKSRDINESDTVTVVADMLSDIFGYDKYLEITSEYAIRNTYCDLAIKQNGEVVYLIECKAIGKELREEHLKQAIDYSANKGIDWAILTNGQLWKVYRVMYEKPIRAEEVFTLDFLDVSARKPEVVERIYILTKEALSKSVIEAYHERAQIINKHMIAAMLLTDDACDFIRKKLRCISKEARADLDVIRNILMEEVFKRDIADSDEIKSALQRVKRTFRKSNKPSRPCQQQEATGDAPEEDTDTVMTDDIEITPSQTLDAPDPAE